MEIREISIKNYKSIKEISIKNPNPFTVFVGPNAAGKSNIFDALEFYSMYSKNGSKDVIRLFGDINNFSTPKTAINNPRTDIKAEHFFELNFNSFVSNIRLQFYDSGLSSSSTTGFYDNDYWKNVMSNSAGGGGSDISEEYPYWENKSYIQFFAYFSRIFVGNEKIEKLAFSDDKKLSLSCNNLEQVLKRILIDENKKAEMTEWLELLIPGFKSIEIKTEELSGSNNLIIYEKTIQKPLNKKIISDGTYNIISILAALYQADEPQFLCIEEPENGLNPKVVRELVTIFRQQCKEKGHFIWLNTHSQSIVSELTNNEIILVDKVDGETKIKQIQGMDLHGMRMDEALLTNAIGGGIPW